MEVNDPDTNYGVGPLLCGSIFLGEEKTDLWRPIANWDVSSIAAETITAAKMRRYIGVDYGAERAGKVYRCTRPADWVESEVTWNDYKSGTAWTTAGGDYDGVTPTPVGYTPSNGVGWQEITGLLAFVTDAIASRSNIVSVILRLDDENPASADAHQFHEGGDPTYEWELVVEYVGGRRRAAFV